jgi:hypothetical protein
VNICLVGGTLQAGDSCTGVAFAPPYLASFAPYPSSNCAPGLLCDPTKLVCELACDTTGGGGSQCPKGTSCTAVDGTDGTGDCQ